MKKKPYRLAVDAAMAALLPMLMAYALIGERFHEIAGSLMLALFILHHILNRRWYPALRRGKYSARRTFQTLLDAALFVFMVLQPASGILMSKHLYTFFQVPGAAATAREIHLCTAYWGFVLMCVHAGTHLAAPLGRLKGRKKSLWLGIQIAWAAVSVYGCRAFAKRDLADYMFRKTVFAFFDYGEPKLCFFADYAAIMLLFWFVGYILWGGLTGRGGQGGRLSGR